MARLAHGVDLEVENNGQSRSEEIADRQSESKAAPVVDDPVKEVEGLRSKVKRGTMSER